MCLQGGGKPYAIPSRSRYHVCVASQKLVEELTHASIHQVSLRDALWEVSVCLANSCPWILIGSYQRAFPEQTIDGLKINGLDHNGSLSQKTFRHYARLHLPSLQPLLRKRLDETFATEIDSHANKHGEYRLSHAVWMYLCLKLMSMLHRMDTRLRQLSDPKNYSKNQQRNPRWR